MVCPYAWDVPGGVQFHVRDLAEHFIARGHEVRCSRRPTTTQRCPTTSRRAAAPVPVRYNGSVARVTFGPVDLGPGDPLARGGRLRRPAPPRAAEPVGVAHGAVGLDRAGGRDLPLRDAALAGPARGAPAAAAVAGEDPRADRRLRGRPGHRAAPPGRRGVHHPQRRLRRPLRARPGRRRRSGRATPRAPDVGLPRPGRRAAQGPGGGARGAAGGARRAPGRAAARRRSGGRRRTCSRRPTRGPPPRPRCWARSPTPTRPPLLRSVDAYVAPHLGGESFGIVLVEAMAAGAPVVASDLAAFTAVLDGGPHGRPLRDRLARGGSRAAVSTCSPTPVAGGDLRPSGSPGPGCSTGASSPPGSWRCTRRSSPAPSPSPTVGLAPRAVGTARAWRTRRRQLMVDVLQVATFLVILVIGSPGTCRTRRPGSTGSRQGRGGDVGPRRPARAPRRSRPRAGEQRRPRPRSALWSPTPRPSPSSGPPSTGRRRPARRPALRRARAGRGRPQLGPARGPR